MTTVHMRAHTTMKLGVLLTVSLYVFVLLSVNAQPRDYPVQVSESGHGEVKKFEASISFYLVLTNSDTNGSPYEVSIVPDQCCQYLEENDTECSVMELKPHERVLHLGPLGEGGKDNHTGKATFHFRNMYVRFKRGDCSFIINSKGEQELNWKHYIHFDTYPKNTEVIKKCEGFDQDPDRDCTVDCAIKYRGKRSFYVNATGRCVPVVECNTRAKDGVSISAYYDWETNTCHQLELPDDNSYTHIESDTEIPRDVPAQDRDYFPELEPERLEEMSSYQLNCNHGTQDGIYCVCNKGWGSSGIHAGDSTMQYHWCDQPLVDRTKIPLAPRKLTKTQEMILIVILSVANVAMFLTWVYTVVRLCCRQSCARCLARCCKCHLTQCIGYLTKRGYRPVPVHNSSD